MTTGLSALTNSWLNTIRGGAAGTSYTAPAALFIKQHIGDPGATATANAAAMTTRSAVAYATPSGGALALTGTTSFTATATETWSHFSVWDASTAGNALYTGVWTVARSVVSGDVANLNSFGFALTPLAA